MGAPRPRDFVAYLDELLDYSERRTRAELARLPLGVFEAEGSSTRRLHRRSVRLAVRVEVSADGVLLRLRPAPMQRRAPVCSTYAQTFSACAYALKCLIDPDLPVNDGFYRARHGRRAGRDGHELHVAEPGRRRLGDADAARRRDLPRAAAGAARAAARGDEGDDVPRRLRRRRPRERRLLLLPRDVRRRLRRPRGERRARRGAGARPEHRERAGRGDRAELPGAGRAAPLVDDSEGPGRFRGGLGLRKDFVFDRPTTFTVLADRTRARAGGRLRRSRRPASRSTCSCAPARSGGWARRRRSSSRPGDTICYRTCGGGGYGPPFGARPASACCATCPRARSSVERAREVYGVTVDERRRADGAARRDQGRRRSRL